MNKNTLYFNICTDLSIYTNQDVLTVCTVPNR